MGPKKSFKLDTSVGQNTLVRMVIISLMRRRIDLLRPRQAQDNRWSLLPERQVLFSHGIPESATDDPLVVAIDRIIQAAQSQHGPIFIRAAAIADLLSNPQQHLAESRFHEILSEATPSRLRSFALLIARMVFTVELLDEFLLLPRNRRPSSYSRIDDLATWFMDSISYKRNRKVSWGSWLLRNGGLESIKLLPQKAPPVSAPAAGLAAAPAGGLAGTLDPNLNPTDSLDLDLTSPMLSFDVEPVNTLTLDEITDELGRHIANLRHVQQEMEERELHIAMNLIDRALKRPHDEQDDDDDDVGEGKRASGIPLSAGAVGITAR